MKVSLDWLGDYVALPPDLTAARIMHDLTMTTVEVEAVHDLAAGLRNVVVGRIDRLAGTPDKDALHVVECNAGERTLRIVCGAVNLATGMHVPVALPGARIRPHGGGAMLTVAARDFNGIASEAVICTADELDLHDLFPQLAGNEVPDLSELSPAAGAPLAEVIGWDDLVLEIDNKSLTNRPDLWGHLGIARELAAIYSVPLKPTAALPATLPRATLLGEVAAAGCKRFTATRLSGIRVTDAPFKLRSRLARIGQRPIDGIVDLTNYVMFAVGQPNHAYDAAKLRGPLGARAAREGEAVKLLDDRRYALDREAFCIVDDSGPVGLAGVMGGAATGVSADTREVILEIANFDAVRVRRAATRLGLRTEASARFEKAIDTQRIDAALALFAELLRETQPGAAIAGFHDVTHETTTTPVIEVTTAYLHGRLGKALPPAEMAATLGTIGFEVELLDAGMRVVVPSWRATGDVGEKHDLVEEVARLHGYDRFEFIAPRVALVRQPPPRLLSLERRLKLLLAARGMQEVVSYPWVKDRFLEACGAGRDEAVQLWSAPAPDQSSLRTSLIPNLLEAITVNLRYFERFRIFEAGPVFRAARRSEPLSTAPVQSTRLAAALVGDDAQTLFREARGIIEAIKRLAHLRSLYFVPGATATWAEQEASLGLGADEHAVGTIGVLTNRTRRLAGIKRASAVLFEIDLSALNAFASRENRFAPLPEFPEVDFDLSLVFSADTAWQEIRETAQRVDPLIRTVVFVDQYTGQGIPPGHKSITLRLRLGASDRTLVSEEVNEVGARVCRALEAAFQAHLRS